MNELIHYFDRVRERTMRVIGCIPPDRIDWTYKEGKFTFADLMRHLASLERWMFVETLQGHPNRYPGHGKELADGYDDIVAYMRRMHAESMAILETLDMDRKCITPGGAELSAAKWIRSMIEHEVHHRGQIYVYLGLLGIDTPPLYGLTEEEVQRRAGVPPAGPPPSRRRGLSSRGRALPSHVSLISPWRRRGRRRAFAPK